MGEHGGEAHPKDPAGLKRDPDGHTKEPPAGIGQGVSAHPFPLACSLGSPTYATAHCRAFSASVTEIQNHLNYQNSSPLSFTQS